MRKPHAVLAALAALASPLSAAHAQETGTQSSGSFSIRVTIQPLGPALQAANEFAAVGLWTFAGPTPGLMLSGPDFIETGKAAEIALFAHNVAPLVVRSAVGATPLEAVSGQYQRDLRRRRVTIQPVATREELGGRNSQMFIVGTV